MGEGQVVRGENPGSKDAGSIPSSGRDAGRAHESTPFLYEPEDFDPRRYGGAIARHHDAARWFMSTIYIRRLLRNYEKGDFVNLHSDLLSLVMDINLVRPLRDALEEHGLIECDHKYEVGGKSLGYRLGPVSRDARWHRYTSKDKRFTRRVLRFKAYLTRPEGFSIPIYDHLRSWCERISFSATLPNVLRSIPETPYEGSDWGNKRELATHQVDVIRDGYLNFAECRFGRFHSNYTALCGELRRCLVAGGKPLFEIDLVNSQPCFLSIMMMEVFLSGGHAVSAVSDLMFAACEDHSRLITPFPAAPTQDQSDQEREGGETTGQEAPYVSGLSNIENYPIPPDLQDMIHRTTEGSFYEAFVERQKEMSRSEVKKKLFVVLFGESKLMENTPLGKDFLDIYPTACDLMMKLKSSKGHKWVGQELQRRESQAVIRNVCERLRAEHAHIPLVTVHDSIMTTEEHLETVLAVLEDAFRRQVFRPRFTIKEPMLESSNT